MREFREYDEDERNEYAVRRMTFAERNALLKELGIISEEERKEQIQPQELPEISESNEVEKASQIIERAICESQNEERRVYRMDVPSELELEDHENVLEMNLREIEERLNKRFRHTLGRDERLQCCIIERELYIRKIDESPTRLENAYGDLYYYFRDRESLERYLSDAGKSLGLEDKSLKEIEHHIHRLASQMVKEPTNDTCINPKINRIRGDYIDLINDISQKTLPDLEGAISKITGQNGHGGIENPRFPTGETLETVVTRFVATVLSDCTMEPNGVIKYAEPEMARIERVIENLSNLGEVKPSIVKIEDGNYHLTHFSFVFGKILMCRGIPTGDRTIQNPGLPSSIAEGSEKVKLAYVEDVTPQDWCVGERVVIVHRTNALHAGSKTQNYGFISEIGQEEMNLIRKYGRKEEANATSMALSWGKLEDLQNDSDASVVRIAENLERIAWKNSNRLMEDEASLVQSLGVNMEVNPSVIRIYPNTNRVTITWQARTIGIEETLKLGIIAPPNDVQKKEKVRMMIQNHSDEMNGALDSLRKQSMGFDRWWDEL